ncbi:MAG: CDP-alcohol phosphatidyltransferase family protein [Candidatus Nealsonbacteria bacterium]|nr:CDP-alcohol phosphatidyltransferase family protein [Candidatus Nealsonbacteria bacterium]
MENVIKKENIYNAPNFLTLLRILFALLCVYFIFADFSAFYIISAFVLGMLTDLFDGQVARRFNLKTEFGRQFDMVADKIFIIGVVLAITIKLNMAGFLTESHAVQMFLIMSREIICFPFVLAAFFLKLGIPHVRMPGKIMTFMQSIAVPLLLINIFYHIFYFSWYISIITGVVGIIASFYYIYDVVILLIRKKLNLKI